MIRLYYRLTLVIILGNSMPVAARRAYSRYSYKTFTYRSSPYFSVEPYVPGPAKCQIKQVNLVRLCYCDIVFDASLTEVAAWFQLYRHGARSPTTGASVELKATLNKFKTIEKIAPDLRFIKDYTYTMVINNLLPFGALE